VEGVAGGVEGVAVELDDEVVIGPRAVRFDSLDERVDPGRWETAVVGEGEEAGLEVASGVAGGCRRAERSDALLGRVPVEERVWTRETLDLGLVEGLLQLVAGEDAGEVEERAGGGGGGDSVVRGRLVRWENRSVKEESWPLGARPGRGDLDAAVRGPDALRGRRSPRPRQVGRVGPIAPTTKRTWLTTPIVTAAPQQNSLP
jgi:hypothetical protein